MSHPRILALVVCTALAAMAAGCGGGGRCNRNPVRLVLTNRTGEPVQGVVLRFDRELLRVDRVGTGARVFSRVRLRMARADTLRLGGGSLAPGARVRYELTGAGGAPRLLEGRWLAGGRIGPPLHADEVTLD